MARIRLSLEARLALTVTAVFAITAIAGERLIVNQLGKSIHVAVAERLSSFITRLSKQTDDTLEGLDKVLAGEVAMIKSVDRERWQEMLARPGAAPQPTFDYGVLIIGNDGRVVADSLAREGWSEVDFSASEFFQRSFARKTPLVSEPFAEPRDGKALVMLTHPVHDEEGAMIAVLAGGLDLANSHLITQLTGLRASRFGQIGVFTNDGKVVAHTDKSLILDDFENPLPASPAADGEAGTLEVDIPGGSAILTFRKLANADWIVAGTFPTQEMYAPIINGFADARLWYMAGMALCCVLVWLLAGSLAGGLTRLSREVAAIGGRPGERVTVGRNDEVGALAEAINAMLQSLETAQKEIRDLSAEVAGVEERERRAIAADLHDSVSQTLALANLRLGEAQRKLADDPAKANQRIEEVKGYLEQSVNQLRTLIFDLSPTILYELGLGPALEWYSVEFNRKFPLKASFADSSAGPPLSEKTAVFLFRAAQELLANAAKHSNGNHVEVALSEGDSMVVLSVRDNGRPSSEPRASNGFGLKNLAERIRHFNGTLTITPDPASGFSVELTVPTAQTGKTGKE